MKTTFIFQTTLQNKSRFTVDNIWENAQDLEHVGRLHPRTNEKFELLHSEPHHDKRYAYKMLVYQATRKILFLKYQTFGFRKIVGDYHLQQFERMPALGVTSCLNSTLALSGDPEFPTLLTDEVRMELPMVFKPFTGLLQRLLKRHTQIQCEEDESFRQRREDLLENRQIYFPVSLFHTPTSELMWREFSNQVEPRLQAWSKVRPFPPKTYHPEELQGGEGSASP